MAWVQFSTPDLPDNDGFYHIKMAELMRQQGLKPNFIWLPLSVLNPREFYDHHFLFHVELIPFTFGDLRVGAKLAAVTNAALAFLAVWWLLRGQKVPYAALWALGLLAVSQAFLYRMSIPRAQSLSLAVLALGLHWMLHQRYHWLLPLGFLYVWLYNAFPLLLVMAVLYSVSVWFTQRRLEYRPVLYSALGIALGLVINPYFPADLVFIYRHYLPKLTDATAVNVGSEWYPYNTQQILDNSTLALGAFLVGAFALGMRGRRMDLSTMTGFFLAVAFGAMLFKSRRFIEYFPPFALIFAALAVSAWLSSTDEPEADSAEPPAPGAPGWAGLWERWQPWILPVVLALVVAAGSFQMLPQARSSVRSSDPYTLFSGASAWLASHTDPGERVFQTDWDDFPRLFFYNTHNTYLIGLDPTYMQLYDSSLYDLWVEITQGKVERPSSVIKERFGARYIVSDLEHTDFLWQVSGDPAMQEVYRDERSVVLRIR